MSSRGAGAATTALCALVSALALLLVTGCSSGSDEQPMSHPTQDTTITAEMGERFTLSVPENSSTREHWYVVAPQPDASVLRTADRRYESPDDGRSVGGDGTLVFTFEATGRGNTQIVLLHCTFPTAGTKACGGDGSSAAAEPARITYTVTVD
ncbi:protease inhibitor I42 family protein [Streptomyces sp. NPDC020951]|uniref:protease inhibitor I42 family protein n=1 Tax=Streptomyces sp. NPDC020951 TaxID=3365104 RepID=UPI00378FA7C1